MPKVCAADMIVILEALCASIRALYADKRDRTIIEINVNERSMVAQVFCRLRSRLKRRLPLFDVDYEYNRHIEDPKRAWVRVERQRKSFVSVIPDMVVHKRGGDEYNACVMEFKKPGVNEGLDEEKLVALTDESGPYQYDIGLRIVLARTCEETTFALFRSGIKCTRSLKIGEIVTKRGALRRHSEFAKAIGCFQP